jgi:enoyl-CoA hydratase/carnithine racemase
MVVTATNGHAFGMGALTHICGDIRLTRTEKGFWCLPEVSLGMPFTSGLSELITTKLGRVAAPLLMTTGERLGSTRQVEVGVSHKAVPIEDLDGAAIESAKSCLANSTPAVKAMKGQLFAGAIEALEAPLSFD